VTLRERIARFLELAPPAPAPLPRVLDRWRGAGYARSLVEYPAPEGDRVEAYLFEPDKLDGPPTRAVLALHQHNSQWTMGKSEIAGLVGDPLQAFAPALAQRGVLVLAPDAVGFESRLQSAAAGTTLAPSTFRPGESADGWLQYYNQMAHRLVRGDLLMRKVLGDAMTAVSVLSGSGAQGRLGVVGHSMGGSTALFLAAVDERLDAACVSGAACSFRYKLAHGGGLEMSAVIPGFAAAFDLEDLLASIAPRRVFIVSAEDDPASADADDLVARAGPAFDASDAGAHLEHLRTPGGHALDERRFNAIVDWVDKVL
jgi:dienelactone hydrolase